MSDSSVQTLFTQLQASFEQLSQRALALAQLQLGGITKEVRERLQPLVSKAVTTGSVAELEAEVKSILAVLTPEQIEVVITSLPIALERALLTTVVYQVATQDPALDPSLVTACHRAYANSGLPILLDAQQQVLPDPSVALLSMMIAVEIASATASRSLQLFGAGELSKLFIADAQLRRTVTKQSSQSLGAEWQELQERLVTSPSDWYLAFVQAGIQAAQVAEFVGKLTQSVLNSSLIRFIAFGPFELLLDVIQLLTSDLILSVGSTLESNLESVSASRRVELLLEALAQRIPSPDQVLTIAPEVIAQAEQLLRPLMAKQLMTVADALDPQQRNDWLNQLGQELNRWNPFQVLQGWVFENWLEGLQAKIAQLRIRYGDLPTLSDYGSGVEQALKSSRVMEQAQALRTAARRLDPSL